MTKNINKRFKRLLNSLLVFVSCLLIFFLGFKTSESGYYDEVVRPRLKDAVLPVINVFKSSPKEILEVSIDIPDKDFDRIKEIRAQVLKDGVFLEGKDEWYSAEMAWQDTAIAIELRLKGGLLDHLDNDRWSFRIRSDSSFRGLSRFSIQHPNTRNFVYERILHQLAKAEGLIALRYEFQDIRINNEIGGLYAVEQHFDQDLLLENDRWHGPILKFDDEARIAWLAHEKKLAVDTLVAIPNFYLSAGIDVYDALAWRATDPSKAIMERAVELLNGFRSGRYRTRAVFDVEQLSTLFALADLLGAQHCTDWRNLRFYYDAAKDRLEPIVYDGNAGERIPAIRPLREQGALRFDTNTVANFFERLFSDRAFYEAYIAEAERYSRAGVLESMLDPIRDDVREQVGMINVEFPNFRFEEAVFQDCRRTIQYAIDPPVAIHAYLDSIYEKELQLEIGLAQKLPVEVLKVKAGKNEWVPPTPYIVLPNNRPSALFLRYTFFALGHLETDVKGLEVHYRLLGSEKVRTEKVRPYSSGLKADAK